jgi:hypothetical protein
MHIELNENTEKLLKMVLATGRYDSVDEIIADAAGVLQMYPSSPTIQRMPEHVDIDDLAAEQGIGFVTDFRDLKADFFPPNETTNEFLSFLHADNHHDVPRVR